MLTFALNLHGTLACLTYVSETMPTVSHRVLRSLNKLVIKKKKVIQNHVFVILEGKGHIMFKSYLV